MLEAAKYGIVLMRNNSGALKDVTGRLVRYGLGNVSSKQNLKSSDLIGIIPPHGRIIAVEVKRSDWKPSLTDKREQGQRNFLEFVKSKGGVAGFCKSIDDFKNLLGY
jgi:hypothetical protein